MSATLSDEDKALFRQAMAHLPVCQTKQQPTLSSPVETPSTILTDSFQHNITGESPLFYCQTALEKNQLHRFKKGLLPIEGRLDLHGLVTEQAKTALIQFIQTHVTKNHRLLLIIHGKGNHNNFPRLKNLLNHWLPQFWQVLAFVSAQPKHGGTGAVYVLLKH